MSGQFDDPTQWRLQTLYGTPYRYLGMDGSFEDESGNVTVRVLVHVDDLYAFMEEILPPPLTIGFVSVPQGSSMPGFPNMIAKRVKFKGYDNGLPIAPFGFDLSAPAGTYSSIVEVDIEYGSETPKNTPDPNDPQTFLEISANATGEFLHTSNPGSRFVEESNPTVTDDENPSDPGVDPRTGEVINPTPTKGNTVPNRDPMVPMTIVQPQTEWSVTWPQIPYDLFRDVIIHRVRAIMGRVNDGIVPFLFNAYPETLLFTGYTYRQSNTWRSGMINTPPVTLTMKFNEKRIMWNGVIVGHNHFWKPGAGWTRLLYDGTHSIYKSWNFLQLFAI